MITDDIEAFRRHPARPPGADRSGSGGKDHRRGHLGQLLSVASPFETIRRRKFGLDAARLLEIATERHVGGIILGLPRNMDGSEGPRCQSTRAFARNLERLTDLPIGFWDERLSTVAAEKALLEADATRKRRAEVIDNIAASYILQGVLDRLSHLRAAP